MECFLYLENRFQPCLLRCLLIPVRLVFTVPTFAHLSADDTPLPFHLLGERLRSFFSASAVQILMISGFSTLFPFMFSV